MRVGFGPAAATLPLGMTFGALAVTGGWGPWAPIVASMLAFSGSAQFAAATVLTGGGGGALAVTAAALMNARFVPMGLAIGPYLSGGRIRKAVESLALVDASWVGAHLGGGRFDRYRLFGATAVQYPAWLGGTVLGVVFAPSPAVIETYGRRSRHGPHRRPNTHDHHGHGHPERDPDAQLDSNADTYTGRSPAARQRQAH